MSTSLDVGRVVELPVPTGTRLYVAFHLLVVEAAETLAISSTAVLGGGIRLGRCIVSMHVPSDYAGLDPGGDIRDAARREGWVADVGLMTAVPLDRAEVSVQSADGATVAAIVTAGVTRPWSAGLRRRRWAAAGTINVIALADVQLSSAAALNVMTTITEAKVLALAEAGIRTADGEPASGTATDAIVVACPRIGNGPAWKFGGPATPPGWAAAAATRAALRLALEAAHA